MKYIILDIETTGLDKFNDELLVLCAIKISFDDKGKLIQESGLKTFYPKDRDRFIEYAKGCELVAHYAQFDIPFINEKWNTEYKATFCTRILAYLDKPYRGRYGLKDLVTGELKQPNYDISLEAKTTLSKEMIDYCKKDVRYTTALFVKYYNSLTAKELKLGKILTKLDLIYGNISRDGWLVDLDIVKAKSEEVNLRLEELKLFFDSYNCIPSSSQQVAEVLYNQLKAPVLDKSPKGAPSTSAPTMKKLLDRKDLSPKAREFVLMKQEFTTLNTLNTKFLKQWMNSGGIVYPRFHLTSTKTGRTSCSDPNIQQIPRGAIRQVFKAPEGYCFVECDYSQIELRVAAHIVGIQNMLTSFRNGEDLHEATAKGITGKAKVTKEERTNAKMANFGFLYGMGAYAFELLAFNSYGVKISTKEAEFIRNGFFKNYPELLGYYEFIQQTIDRQGYVENPIGRRYKIDRPTTSFNSRDRSSIYRGAINAVVQSFASDILLLSILKLSESAGDEIIIKGSIHDAIIFYIKDNENLAKNLRLIKDTMENVVKLDLPVIADVEVYKDRWYGELKEIEF